ncbi:response regulator [Rhodanobacter sp. Root561]|uniref:response regulator n=1 Tax=Rhodanobacter sp. FW021-MT20 TaxID=1162282 RepID=UPI0002610444|nr:response regulator [Rhodanobacter sp. 115]EIL96758.1 response regulator [Rhodanobacter sp. 115]KQZ72419.1 response regulator [Rhodanobacter sp. Root561]
MTFTPTRTILLAEDDRNAREVTALVLEAAGYKVITTGNGTIALDILQNDATVDLLLSDIQMPGGIDGIELARRVQMKRQMPIVLTSADPRSSFTWFPDNVIFLPKPYDRRALLAAVTVLPWPAAA